MVGEILFLGCDIGGALELRVIYSLLIGELKSPESSKSQGSFVFGQIKVVLMQGFNVVFLLGEWKRYPYHPCIVYSPT